MTRVDKLVRKYIKVQGISQEAIRKEAERLLAEAKANGYDNHEMEYADRKLGRFINDNLPPLRRVEKNAR